MATRVWIGGAAAVAQETVYEFAGTWVIGDIITVTIGQKAWPFTIASATIATFLASLVEAYNAIAPSAYPEQFEQSAAVDGTDLILTAKTAGKPFSATISTDSVAGTIDAGASSAGAVTVASAGPEDVSTAANWSGATLPVNGDTVIVDREGARLRYGLAALAGVTAAARRIVARDVEIGLPLENEDGTPYAEYRPRHWQIGVTSDFVATESGRIQLDFGSVQTAYEQTASGSGDGTPAVTALGTHASNAFNVFGGEFGLAVLGGEVSTALTIRLDEGATVVCGSGCTLGTVNNYGGTAAISCAIGTALNHPGIAGGTTILEGTGAVAQLTMQSGTCVYNTTGTLGGNTVLAGNAALIFDDDQQAKTVTNPIAIHSGQVTFRDRFGVISGGYTLQFVECVGVVDLKPNSQVVVTAL